MFGILFALMRGLPYRIGLADFSAYGISNFACIAGRAMRTGLRFFRTWFNVMRRLLRARSLRFLRKRRRFIRVRGLCGTTIIGVPCVVAHTAYTDEEDSMIF